MKPSLPNKSLPANKRLAAHPTQETNGCAKVVVKCDTEDDLLAIAAAAQDAGMIHSLIAGHVLARPIFPICQTPFPPYVRPHFLHIPDPISPTYHRRVCLLCRRGADADRSGEPHCLWAGAGDRGGAAEGVGTSQAALRRGRRGVVRSKGVGTRAFRICLRCRVGFWDCIIYYHAMAHTWFAH